MDKARPSTEKTPQREKALFLEALAEIGVVSYAASAAGVERSTPYVWRKKDPEFAAAWDSALEESIDALEVEARRRALVGTDKPVFYQGKECGRVREYSDTLMCFLLTANRPEKYRKRVSMESNVDMRLTSNVEALPEEHLDALLAGEERVDDDDD